MAKMERLRALIDAAQRASDGLGMAPRPGEPESALIPGMAAPAPPAPQIGPVERFGLFGHVQLGSMPDTSGPGPTALETPLLWNYDFDPASGNARATFSGLVLINGAPVVTGGVASFNTRTGAVALLQADVSAVAVGSFNTRTGAVVLTTADVNAVAPAPGASAGNGTTFLTGANVGLSTVAATPTIIVTTGATGAAGQVWEITAILYFVEGSGAAVIAAAISNGTIAIAGGEATTPASAQPGVIILTAIVTLAGPTTFTLLANSNNAGVVALRAPNVNTTFVPSFNDKMTCIKAVRIA